MEIKCYQTLVLEIFKTLNDLNPTYMQDFFIYLPDPQDDQMI